MCRLLGVVSRAPRSMRQHLIDVPQGLLGMSLRGVKAPHRDGVGWAYRDTEGRMRLRRWGAASLGGGESLPGDPAVTTDLLVAHARKASPEYRSALGALQTHPLVREGVFLAHNGTIRDTAGLGSGVGTGSQRVLEWLGQAWVPRRPDRLAEALRELLGLVRDFTAVNLLLTDGVVLYAFCHYACEPDYYTLHLRDGEGEVVVASEPIDDQPGWTALHNGELLVVHPDLSTAVLPVAPSPL